MKNIFTLLDDKDKGRVLGYMENMLKSEKYRGKALQDKEAM